jgi:hypothetical protein
MATPVPRTWVSGEFVVSSFMNGLRDALNYLLSPPRVKTFRSADKSTSSGVDTLYDMDSESYDSNNAHSNVTNNSRLVAPETGLCHIIGVARWAANASGSRQLQVRSNAAGSAVGGTQLTSIGTLPTSGSVGFAEVVADVVLNAGDYIEMFTNQSAGTLNVLGGVANTFLSMRWVALP